MGRSLKERWYDGMLVELLKDCFRAITAAVQFGVI